MFNCLNKPALVNDKFLLLDFDGVLADSWTITFDKLNSFSREYGFKPITSHEAKNLTTREILHRYNIGFLKKFFLVRDMKKSLSSSIDKLLVFEDFSELCQSLSANGVKVGVVTSNSKENVLRFLEVHKIKYIRFIQSDSTLFGKHQSIIKSMTENGIKPDNALYVGDEIRDIHGARKAGIKIIAVSWGYDPIYRLEEANPDVLVSTARQAEEFILDHFKLPRS